MVGRSKCVDCPPDHRYQRTELYSRKKNLYCEGHARDIDQAALVSCFKCPSSHGGWKQSEVRRRKGMDYCAEHLPPDPKTWPDCPKCGDDDFGRFNWKGSVEKTTITCEKCGFTDLATNHHEPMVVWVVASPIGAPTPK